MNNKKLPSQAIIFGSVGVNRGDDLMNRVLHNACVRAGYEVSIASIDPTSYAAIYGGDVFSSSKSNMLNWFKRIYKADCVIIGGGTMIQNDFGRTGFSGILLYASSVLFMAAMLRVPRIYVIGIGINKISRKNWFFAQFFRFADVILVRDAASVHNARMVGLSKYITASHDVGLAASLYDSGLKNDTLGTPLSHAERPYVCLSIAKEKSEIAAYGLAKKLVSASIGAGLDVRLLAMDIREEEELGIYRKLKDEFREAVTIVIPKNPFELVPMLRAARLCIGMRLHFCVLSVVAGQKVVVVSREQKTEWLAEFVGKERFIDFFSATAGDQVVKIIAENATVDNGLDQTAITKLKRIDAEITSKLQELLQRNEAL